MANKKIDGYSKGDNHNIPFVDAMMLAFFFSGDDFYSAEVRGWKNDRAARESYGDHAIGYVQLKRVGSICSLVARITPEHKNTATPYEVKSEIDEKKEDIISASCVCSAKNGGCKHVIAFLCWLHRRTEDKSRTEVLAYWKKAPLSDVGKNIKTVFATDFAKKKKKPVDLFEEQLNEILTLMEIIEKGRASSKNTSAISVFRYFSPSNALQRCDMHLLIKEFVDQCRSGQDGLTRETISPNMFIDFIRGKITKTDTDLVVNLTTAQSKSPAWFKVRYGRITASRLYEASKSKTYEGSLCESILGTGKNKASRWMKRGIELERKVIAKVEKMKSIRLNETGLWLSPDWPVLGASPDGLNADFIAEVKCPSSHKTIEHYITKENVVQSKCMFQIQLQMMLTGRKRALFCVADPNFEKNEKVQVVEILYDEQFPTVYLPPAIEFWKCAIFPKLVATYCDDNA